MSARQPRHRATPERFEWSWRLKDEHLDLTVKQAGQAFQWQLADVLYEHEKSALSEPAWRTTGRVYKGQPIVDLVVEVEVEPWSDVKPRGRHRKEPTA